MSEPEHFYQFLLTMPSGVQCVTHALKCEGEVAFHDGNTVLIRDGDELHYIPKGMFVRAVLPRRKQNDE